MEAHTVKRQRLAGSRQAAEEDELQSLEDEEDEEDEGDEVQDPSPAAALFPLPMWKQRRRLMREALSPSSGLFEDLFCEMDGYLGKMDVNELRCVGTIGSRGEGEGQFQGISGISVDAAICRLRLCCAQRVFV